MNDQEILAHINQLVDEERGLRDRAEAAHHELSDAEGARLRGLEVALDQLWDLLRQRQALREYGRDPDAAKLRDPGTVEGYTA